MNSMAITENDILTACSKTLMNGFINKTNAAKLLGYKANLMKKCRFEILFNKLVDEGKIIKADNRRYIFSKTKEVPKSFNPKALNVTKDMVYDACLKYNVDGVIRVSEASKSLGFHGLNKTTSFCKAFRTLIDENKIIVANKRKYILNDKIQVISDNKNVPLKMGVVKTRCEWLKDAISQTYNGCKEFPISSDQFIDLINKIGTPVANNGPYIHKLVKDGFIEKVYAGRPSVYKFVQANLNTDAEVTTEKIIINDLSNNKLDNILGDINSYVQTIQENYDEIKSKYEDALKEIEIFKNKNEALETQLLTAKNEVSFIKASLLETQNSNNEDKLQKAKIENLELLLAKAQADTKAVRDKLYELSFIH